MNTDELITLIHKIYKDLNDLEVTKKTLEEQLKQLNQYYEESQKEEEKNYNLQIIKKYHNYDSVNLTLTTPDYNSFKSSKNQVGEILSKRIK